MSEPFRGSGGEKLVESLRSEDLQTGIPFFRSRVPGGASYEDMRRLRAIDDKFNAVLLSVHSLIYRRVVELVNTKGPYGPGVHSTHEMIIQKDTQIMQEKGLSYADHLEESAAKLTKRADAVLNQLYRERLLDNIDT